MIQFQVQRCHVIDARLYVLISKNSYNEVRYTTLYEMAACWDVKQRMEEEYT